jgi:hypothetical protein
MIFIKTLTNTPRPDPESSGRDTPLKRGLLLYPFAKNTPLEEGVRGMTEKLKI